MIDWSYMETAAEISKLTVFEDQRPHPYVGALLVDRSGDVVASSFRGQFGRGDHAEFLLLELGAKAKVNFSQCVLYTTLEPCTSRGHTKTPCALRIAEAGIENVAIGMVDPNPRMRGLGIHELQKEGVAVHLAPPHIYSKLLQLNWRFVEQFPKTA